MEEWHTSVVCTSSLFTAEEGKPMVMNKLFNHKHHLKTCNQNNETILGLA